MQNGFKLLAGANRLFPNVEQPVQMGLDLALVPGQHDGLHVRIVLVKGGAADTRALAKVMPPAVRKAALTVHIIASVGWLGAIAAFWSWPSPDSHPLTLSWCVQRTWA
ncbi:MAG: hypothetical protein WAL27_01100 [Cellulosimicrobium cellulans]